MIKKHIFKTRFLSLPRLNFFFFNISFITVLYSYFTKIVNRSINYCFIADNKSERRNVYKHTKYAQTLAVKGLRNAAAIVSALEVVLVTSCQRESSVSRVKTTLVYDFCCKLYCRSHKLNVNTAGGLNALCFNK